MAASTRSRVGSATGVRPRSTFDTVPTDTPAVRATSFIVTCGERPLRAIPLRVYARLQHVLPFRDRGHVVGAEHPRRHGRARGVGEPKRTVEVPSGHEP